VSDIQRINFALLHDTFVDDDPDKQSSSFEFNLIFLPEKTNKRLGTKIMSILQASFAAK